MSNHGLNLDYEPEWSAPPAPPGRITPDTVALLERLKDLQGRPGEWCRIAVCESVNGADRFRNILRKRPELAGFEFATRRIAERTSGLWARWTDPVTTNAGASE